MKQKALRRFNTWKKQKQAEAVVSKRWYTIDCTTEEIHRIATRVRDNLKDCSCPMCCNPRHCKWTKAREQLTIQERRMIDQFNMWLNE